MKERHFLLLIGALTLTTALLLVGGLVLAQETGPQADLAPQAALGAGFTYQGRLQSGGAPISGTCQMAFRLYDADAPGGSQVGVAITHSVDVSDGYFTTKLDFGGDAFGGDARWLGIEVECEGDPGYTDLGRQAITAAPYALYALRAPWSGLRDMPQGFADGVDDVSAVVSGTQIFAGEGLNQVSSDDAVTLSLASTYRLPQTCANGQIAEWNDAGSFWECGDDDEGGGGGGDVTAVYAGYGLGGGGLSGPVTLTVDFAGSGSAATVARSDHDHWGEAWSGSGAGLTLDSSDAVGIHATGGTDDESDYGGWFQGYNGVYGRGTGIDGYGGHFKSDDDHGVYVEGTGNLYAGVYVLSAGADGIFVNHAGGDGVTVHRAGNPSTTQNSTAGNGFQVNGAGGNGLFVGRADDDGVRVFSAGRDGVHATGGSDDGEYGGYFQGYNGVKGYGTGANGYGGYFKSDNDHGIYIELAGDDGVHVESANGNGVHVQSADNNGIHIQSADVDGVHVSSADGDGVEVVAATFDGVEVGTAGEPSTTHNSTAKNGFEVDGAEGNGLYVGRADVDGVHVYSAGDCGVRASGGTDNDTDYGGWFQGYNGVYGYGTGTLGYGGQFKSDNNHGIYVEGGTGSTDDGVHVTSAGRDGVRVNSASAHGVYAQGGTGSDDCGGYFRGYHGVYGQGTGDTGYGGRFVSDHGHGIYVRGGTSAASAGVFVESAGGDGVHAIGGSDIDECGGWFYGYHGVYGRGAGAYGDGGYFKSDNNHGVYVESAGRDGVHIASADLDGVNVFSAGDDGICVESAGDDGVYVANAGDIGVYANTTAADDEWGFYTPDKMYAGTSLASGGPMMFVAQNGDAGDLEPGDVVAAAGLGVPFAGSDALITLVRRADPASSAAVVGVVYHRFVVEEEVDEVEHDGEVERHTHFETHTTEGSIAPGEYLLIVVLGTCEVKVDATGGAISPGDPLTLSSATQGRAVRTKPLTLEGVSFYPPGVTFGTALAALDEGTGVIPVFVTRQ